MRPSAATRPAFLAAFDRPFLRSQSCAACMSPPLSVSAALQSIMPAPVDSRRSLTIAAVIVAIVERPLTCQGNCAAALAAALPSSARKLQEIAREGNLGWEEILAGRKSGHRITLFRFGGKRLGLGNPAIGAARKSDLFTDLVGGIVVEFGELP